MSLAADLAPLARDLIAPEGFPVQFTRTVPGAYDEIEDAEAEPTTLTWSGTAMWKRNGDGNSRPTRSIPGSSAQFVHLRTLLLAGFDLTRAPEPADRALVNGLTYQVSSVTNVADTDGSEAPLYRVEVVA